MSGSTHILMPPLTNHEEKQIAFDFDMRRPITLRFHRQIKVACTALLDLQLIAQSTESFIDLIEIH